MTKNRVWIALLLVAAGARGEELNFPQTEADFVRALPAPARAVTLPQGCPPAIPDCQVKSFGQEKGVADIVDDYPELPKAGILLQFDYNSAVIQPASHGVLHEFAHALRGGLQDAVILIAGHTDYIGSEAFNQTLSERRAAAVKTFLSAQARIDAGRLHTVGYGETHPLQGSRTYQSDGDRAQNRRVELIRTR